MPLTVGALLLWVVFLVALVALVLSVFRVPFALPGWLVWAMFVVLAAALLFWGH